MRKCFELGGIGRQLLGLPIVPVLEPMLDIAQETIGPLQVGGSAAGQDAAGAERGEGRLRSAQSQRRLAPPAHELQRLRDELDLADPAGAELDVGRVIAPLALRPDLPVHVAQSLIRVEIEVLAIDERRDQPVELGMARPP